MWHKLISLIETAELRTHRCKGKGLGALFLTVIYLTLIGGLIYLGAPDFLAVVALLVARSLY